MSTAVATIKDVDEHGPIIEWHQHWAELKGRTLYLTQPAQAVDVEELKDRVKRLVSRNLELTRALGSAQAEGWRPIETAPKDGSVVLVNDTTGAAPWAAAKWLQGEQWSGWIYDDELALDNNPVGPMPTAWIAVPPLPAPTPPQPEE